MRYCDSILYTVLTSGGASSQKSLLLLYKNTHVYNRLNKEFLMLTVVFFVIRKFALLEYHAVLRHFVVGDCMC